MSTDRRARDDERARQLNQVRDRMAASPPEPDRGERSRAERLEQLEEEARSHRRRLRLYRARVYAGRLASVERLRELERIAELADSRLARARAEAGLG